MRYKWIVLIAIICSCNIENKPTPQELIIGDWHLTEGYRNEKLSNIMQHTSFHFMTNGEMSCNLFDGQALNYTINDKTIEQTGFKSVQYNIVKLNKDSLVLKTKIGRFRYLMNLIKSPKQQESK